MERKIVFFDIDGTIYRFDTGIPRDTREAIELLKLNGHIPVICTGRTRCMIYPEHLEPGFDYIVGGAGTYVEINGKERFLYQLEKERTEKLIKSFIKNGFYPVAEGKNNLYVPEDYSIVTEENKKFIDVYYEKIPHNIKSINSPDISISKVSGAFTYDSNMDAMIEEFENEYSIINHSNMLLELVPKPFNKAKGIEIMIKELDIPWENTYAFGDSFNDIDMLTYVKYGCAMGNSDKEIIRRTQYLTDDFDKGGIYNGLKKFGLI